MLVLNLKHRRRRKHSNEKLTLHGIILQEPVQATREYMEGINVISPTWFRIRSFTEPPAPYEYKLDGDNIYYCGFRQRAICKYAQQWYKVWALFNQRFFAQNNSGFQTTKRQENHVSLMRQ